MYIQINIYNTNKDIKNLRNKKWTTWKNKLNDMDKKTKKEWRKDQKRIKIEPMHA
jgi:hypothetical protein